MNTHFGAHRFHLSLLLFAIGVPISAVWGQSYGFTTLAGISPGASMHISDGVGSTARFARPNSVAVDSLGNVYIAGGGNTYVVGGTDHAIRKISADGVVTTFAGVSASPGWADGTGGNAFFKAPMGVAVDSADNVYVADTGNHTIRKITPAGTVTTIAGMAGSSGSTDGLGAVARFKGPAGLAVDSAGNIYVADKGNFTIRKITPAGMVTTLAGDAGVYGFSNGTGSQALFSGPVGLTINATGTLYVVNSDDSSIRQITSAGVVTTFAGSYNVGSADGTGSDALFRAPAGIAADGRGNVYVADTFNHTIRKITADAVVTTLAGDAGSTGSANGTASIARFNSPKGIAVDSSGNIYVADSDNNTVRKVSSAGIVSTLAGAACGPGLTDGTGSDVQFNLPAGIAVDALNNLYVSELGNHTIRKITSTGMVTTLAGTPGVAGHGDGLGAAAQFNWPTGLAVNGSGDVYVSDFKDHVIRKIISTGMVTTFAGVAGGPGSDDGTAAAAKFKNPVGVAMDALGNVYIGDSGNNTIRKISPAGLVTTLAGAPGTVGEVDGIGGSARFNSPSGVAVDSLGNIYVADQGNNAIRKITPSGTVTTIINFDSPGFLPSSLAVDSADNIYSAAFWSNTINKISPDGTLTTIGGNSAVTLGWSDGVGNAALFNEPRGIAVDSSGGIYVTDSANHTIRKGVQALLAPQITSQTPAPSYVTVRGVVTFSVSVSGYPAPNYRWQKNGVDIAGATSASYVIPSVELSDAGTYRVVVTNTAGVATSNGVVLTVHAGAQQDFNNDGHPDVVWQNTSTGERFVWAMNGISHVGGASLGTVATAWSIAATADFNADGHEDILWQNTSTGERYIWFMNGTGHIGGASLGAVATAWSIVGASDFNGDGQPDILWQNTVTGERYIWLMSGAGHFGDISLGLVDTQWSIVALADFNGDGQVDFLWQNTSTGERYVWFMNGTGHVSDAGLGIVNTQWSIATAADFNRDGHPDILWQNTVTGQRYLWLMNGMAHQSDVDLGFVDSNWSIVR